MADEPTTDVVRVLAAHRLNHRRPAQPGPGEAWTCTCGIFRVSEDAQRAHDLHLAEEIRPSCPCGCPIDMHIGEIGCPCALPNEGPCSAPAENWNPNTAGPSCDWCGECEWCRDYPPAPTQAALADPTTQGESDACPTGPMSHNPGRSTRSTRTATASSAVTATGSTTPPGASGRTPSTPTPNRDYPPAQTEETDRG